MPGRLRGSRLSIDVAVAQRLVELLLRTDGPPSGLSKYALPRSRQ
jgi:hypothetical protein